MGSWRSWARRQGHWAPKTGLPIRSYFFLPKEKARKEPGRTDDRHQHRGQRATGRMLPGDEGGRRPPKTPTLMSMALRVMT